MFQMKYATINPPAHISSVFASRCPLCSDLAPAVTWVTALCLKPPCQDLSPWHKTQNRKNIWMEGEEERGKKKKSIHFALDRGASIWTKDGGRITAEMERKRPWRKTHNSVTDKKKNLNDIDPLSLGYLYIFFSPETVVLNVCQMLLVMFNLLCFTDVMVSGWWGKHWILIIFCPICRAVKQRKPIIIHISLSFCFWCAVTI